MKFWIALTVTALVLVQQLAADGALSLADRCQIAATVITAVGVWLVPNTPALTWAKTATAFLGAGFLTAVSLASDGVITGNEWVTMLIAAAGAVGVFALPNAPKPEIEPLPIR